MNEQECLSKMIAPGQLRPSKPYRGGVIQIHVTRACNDCCRNCTQGSNLVGTPEFMPPQMFEQAVLSLKGYFGVYGTFGGNPSVSPYFIDYCNILKKHVPFTQRGLWSNNPITPEKATKMRETFNPSVSNLNVHLDRKAYDMFKKYWPESQPVGLTTDSRHSPVFVAMRDVLKKDCECCDGTGCMLCGPVGNRLSHEFHREKNECGICNGTGKVYDESRAWELISKCDVNQNWSAGIGMFRGQLRAWFCEIAMSQSILHQDDPEYPDTGIPIRSDGLSEFTQGDGKSRHVRWWTEQMGSFVHQVRKHCGDCGVPMKGHGAKAQGSDETEVEQVSETHKDIYVTKRKGRKIELVTVESQLGERLETMTKYLQNVNK